MCCWIVELPALVTARIAHEHAFLHVWLKRASLVLLNEDICKTSPDSEMRDIQFLLEPGFIRCHAFERECRKVVPDMDLVASASPQSDSSSCVTFLFVLERSFTIIP